MIKTLSDDVLAKVSRAIEAKMALHFPRERWNDLEQRLELAAKEFGFIDHQAFCNWLADSNLDSGQAEILASFLTISETYFWREPHVFEALEEKILPELIRSRETGEKRLRIWSAGCATGEEPYSLAIAIKRAIPDYKNWNITILATDINPQTLRRANEGVYGEWSFRNSPAWLQEKFFTRIDKHKYQISAEIRKMVTFAYLNLAEDTYPSPINNTNAMDIIFCRNVLMYFTGKRIQQISDCLFQALINDGWLMVSSSELSLQFFSRFAPIQFREAIVYRKTSQKSCENVNQEIFQSAEFQAELSSLPVFAVENTLDESPGHLSKPEFVFEEQELPQVPLDKETEHKPGKDAGDISRPVRELANQGNLSEALLVCERLILENKLDPVLYFLQASILQEQNRNHEAIASLKRTLYLDPDFYMGHFALGNLLLHQGKKQVAKKYFENALVILARFDQNAVLQDSEELTAGRLREIVVATMQAGALT